MAQALVSSSGKRHAVIENPLIEGSEPKVVKQRKSRFGRNGGATNRGNDVT
jgi:hypothetical protein